jgi:hypothetical protein
MPLQPSKQKSPKGTTRLQGLSFEAFSYRLYAKASFFWSASPQRTGDWIKAMPTEFVMNH